MLVSSFNLPQSFNCMPYLLPAVQIRDKFFLYMDLGDNLNI